MSNQEPSKKNRSEDGFGGGDKMAPTASGTPPMPAGKLVRPPAIFVIAAMLAVQAAVLGIALIWTILQELTVGESIRGGGLVIIVLVAVALLWVLVTAVAILRLAPWSRGSLLAIEIMHLAVAIGLFQGAYAAPGYGWLLLIPALVAILLLLTPPVIQATIRRGDGESGAGA